MKCQLCGKAATVHLTEIINEKMSELHLCEDCAKDKGIAGLGQPFGLQDLLAGLVDFGSTVPADKKTALQCSNCKMSYDDFRKSGRLGCSQCYEVFKESLSPLLKKVHGSLQHIGKGPSIDGDGFDAKKQLQELHLKLQNAIHDEAFEEAARLRDEIKKLEKEIDG
ncbi:MAG: UvrB/UvrC motif-containing protein [Candidatus Omnitrophica bacterium]|nr:UvrB/UvrC motif-containing protein [Candidatus Omnitrophota bacterium]